MPVHTFDAFHSTETPQPLHIGLLNNMPDGALEATERQYRELLAAASGRVPLRFSLFSLPQVPRGEWGRNLVSRRYAGIDELWNSALDGLIVTGAEPRAEDLTDEPYWRSLTEVVDWARQETYSTVWSCLAAHAAVQHLDGIRRRPLPEKRFGVFPSIRNCDHAITDGLPGTFPVPHSRWNDLGAEILAENGYRILTRLEDGSADAWVKDEGSLFLFLQGHPEYESCTLLLEYKRDVTCFVRGERKTYPSMPENYFDASAQQALQTLRAKVLVDRRPADFPDDLASNLPNRWRDTAIRLYANWLGQLLRDRAASAKSRGSYARVAATGD